MSEYILHCPNNFEFDPKSKNLGELIKHFKQYDVINIAIKNEYIHGKYCKNCYNKLIIFKDDKVREVFIYPKERKNFNRIGYTKFCQVIRKG